MWLKCPKVLGFFTFVMLNEFQIQMFLKKWFVQQAGISSPFSHGFSSQLPHSMPIRWLLWNTNWYWEKVKPTDTFVLTDLKASRSVLSIRGVHYEDSLGRTCCAQIFYCIVCLQSFLGYIWLSAASYLLAQFQHSGNRNTHNHYPIVNDKRGLVTDQTTFD